MRKIIVCTMLLFFVVTSFCQQENSSQSLSRQDYLKKSRHQQTAAIVLLSAGLLSTALGSVQINPNSFEGGGNSQSPVFLIAGLAAIGASIPLFVASIKNKRKATNVSTYLRFERVPLLKETGLTLHPYACLALKLNL